MKAQTRPIFTVLLFILTILSLTTCKKDSKIEEPPQSTFEAIQGETNVYPCQFCRIYVKGIEFTSESALGSILAEPINFLKINDTTLLFIMPDIPVGTNNLALTINNEFKQLVYTILEHPDIPDPKNYALTYVDNFENSINNLIAQISSDSVPLNVNIYEVNTYYSQKIRDEINNMNEDELKMFALMIQSNNLNSFKNSSIKSLKYSTIPEEWLKQRRDNLDYDYSMLLLESKIIDDLWYSNNPILRLGALLHIPHYLYYCWWSYWDIGALQLHYSIRSGVIWPEFNKSVLSFANNVPSTLSFKSKYRNINKNDINSSFEFISNIIQTGSGYLTNVLQANSTFLTDKQVTGVSDFSNTEEILSGNTMKIHTNYLNISPNVSNQNVSLKAINKSGYDISLTFSTTQTTNQAFKFDVTYNNSDVSSTTSTIDAVLVPATCTPDMILGTWNLLMYIRDASEPLGYKLQDVYWILKIYANGQMTFQASSETKVQNTTYTFSGCHFSFTLVPSLSPCFDYVDGVNTYIDNLDPSNGYHHVTFIKQ